MKSALRIETKDAVPMDPRTDLPAQFLGGVVAAAHEPLRILDHIPASPMEGPSIEFIAHTSTVGSAGMVAAGGAKPQVQFITTPTILTARKIALWTALLDENLDDFPTFAAYIANELQRLIVDTENDQVLNGDGTGENLKGLLHQTGILTRDHTADVTADPDATGLDTMEMAIADLRTGAAFVDPDMIVMHPTTWSKLRRTKDGQGRYILNPDPSSSEANTLWGIPVLPTTTCAVGTSLVANLEKGAQAFQRKGFVIETTNSAGDAFTTNQTLFRAEERLTLGSPRPAALLKVTNL